MTATTTSGVLRSARRPRGGRMTATAWLFMAPFMIVFVLYTALPTVSALAMSFTNMQGRDLRTPFAVDFVAFDNYVRLLTDPRFIGSLGNTFTFVVVGVPLTMGLGFFIALALNEGMKRTTGVLRGIFFAPVVTNIVAIALIWQYAFNSDGTINEFLGALGIAGPNWLGDPATAMPVVILLGIWRNFGFAMLLFLAGLQAVPADVHEAASLDGAGWWSRLWHITMPLLMPTFLLVTVLLSVFYLNVFEEPYLLTNGGPLGSTESVALFTYHQFGFGQFGVSSAASFIILIAVGVTSVIQFRLMRSRS